MLLGGADVTRASVATRARRAASAHIPEDRHRRGLVLDFTVAENLLLGRQRELAAAPASTPGARAAPGRAARRAPARSRARAMSRLSGGNQQKVVVARELGRPGLGVLLAAQPTRGVDVGAIARIHAELARGARRAARPCSCVSAELDELRRAGRPHPRVLSAAASPPSSPAPSASRRSELGALMTGAAA